jgi:urea transport system permease protein
MGYRLVFFWSVLLAAFLLVPASTSDASAGQAEFESGLSDLANRRFKTREEGLARITGSGAERAPLVLRALFAGEVHKHRASGRVVLVSSRGDAAGTTVILDAASGAAIEEIGPDDLKRIVTNNRMRSELRLILARLDLGAENSATRAVAAKNLMAKPSDAVAQLLSDALAREGDPAVAEVLRTGIALNDLGSVDRSRRLWAIDQLRGSTHAEVPPALEAAVRVSAEDGTEPDAELHAAATLALASIDRKRMFFDVLQTMFFGISLGMVLVLAATGLAITFGVMGVINMAHGEFMMLGAYATWVVQEALPQYPEAFLLIAIPVAFLVSGTAGLVLERGVVRFLYGRPLETLLATFGVSLLLQQAVRSIFSPLNRAVSTPEWMSGQLVINDYLGLTWTRLYIILFGLLVFLLLVIVMQSTRLGLQIRAVAQNRETARALGVRSDWIDAATFGLGSGIAGLAGVALTQLTNVGPNLGQSFIVDSFMVVVFGGVGSLWGTFVSGLTLGIGNKFLEPWVGAVLAKVMVLIFLILFIQKRPRGLFPQRGRAAEG